MEDASNQSAPEGAREPATDQQRSAPLLLGRYHVMASTDTGGFGRVLTCWDTRLQRRVAIKCVPVAHPVEAGGQAIPSSTMQEALAEARTSSLLAHPNIVTMYDFEAGGGWAYLVMEYVDGLTLSELLARVEGGTLTNDECAHLVSSVGAALAFAHENGVLHLDVKPSNIMIDRRGTVKLCDFGMATLASAAGFGGARGGTVGYMSPEQIRGDMVDERADVFSLAVVAWQALTGENPFAASSAEASLSQIERGPSRPLSKCDPTLGGMVEEVEMAALEPSPFARTPSVAQFSQDLAEGLGDTTEGQASLAALMAQATGDDSEARRRREGRDLPLFYRAPWLPGFLQRTLTAISCGFVVAGTAPTWLPADASRAPLAPLVAAAFSAAWTPAGSLVAVASLASSLLWGGDFWSLLAPALLALSGLAWWVRVGRSSKTASASLLLPALLSTPGAGGGLAGLALPPARAVATALLGWAFSQVLLAATETGFSAYAASLAVARKAASAQGLASLAGCALWAAVAAALRLRRGTVAGGVAGQVVGCACLVGLQVGAAAMENGGTPASAIVMPLLVEVVLCLILCAITNLRGPLPVGEEVDQFDEPA